MEDDKRDDGYYYNQDHFELIDDDGNRYVKFVIKGMPFDLWKDFTNRAKESFGNTYWSVILHDMNYVKQHSSFANELNMIFNTFDYMKSELNILSDKVKMLEGKLAQEGIPETLG